jgi:hypothetical protein
MTARPGTPISATHELDEIRLTLEVDRDRIAFGERAWATVTVANVGSDDVVWGHGGCPDPAGVTVLTTRPLDLGYGRHDWPGELGVLKSVTVYLPLELEEGAAAAGFTPERWVDQVGLFGCTTELRIDRIAPGAQITARMAWDAIGPHRLPTPPGDYLLASEFQYIGRGDAAPPEVGPTNRKAVAIQVSVTVDTPAIDYLGAGEAVDRLLEHQPFLDLLEDAPRIGRWTGSYLHFMDGVWMMALYLENPEEAIVATVDAVTGEVTGVVLDEDPPDPVY